MRIKQIIEDNLDNEHFTVEDLAEKAVISRSMLHRKLIKQTGKSATDFITEFRLTRAKELLENDEITSSEIAYLVKGYVDIPLKVDIEQTVPLTVHERHDKSAAKAVSAESDKTFAFGGDSAVKMSASLDTNLHFPGDTVKCRLAVKNKSKKKIQGVIVALQKTETLSAHGKTTTKTQVIHSAKFGKASVAKGKSAKLDLEFTLPANLYPTILSRWIDILDSQSPFPLLRTGL